MESKIKKKKVIISVVSVDRTETGPMRTHRWAASFRLGRDVMEG